MLVAHLRRRPAAVRNDNTILIAVRMRAAAQERRLGDGLIIGLANTVLIKRLAVTTYRCPFNRLYARSSPTSAWSRSLALFIAPLPS
jgi:hypothetical protein